MGRHVPFPMDWIDLSGTKKLCMVEWCVFWLLFGTWCKWSDEDDVEAMRHENDTTDSVGGTRRWRVRSSIILVPKLHPVRFGPRLVSISPFTVKANQVL